MTFRSVERMGKYTTFLAFGLCALVVLSTVHAGHGGKGGGGQGGKGKGKGGRDSHEMSEGQRGEGKEDEKCCMKAVMKSKGCCEMPRLAPREVFEQCGMPKGPMAYKGGRGKDGKGKGRGGKGDKGRSGANTQQPPEATTAPASAPGPAGAAGVRSSDRGKQFLGRMRQMAQGGSDKMGGHGPPNPCMMDCVFKKQNLSDADGKVDIEKVSIALKSNASSADWNPIIDAAIANCTAEVNKMNLTAMPPKPSGAPSCNITTGHLMMCIGRWLGVSCPESAKNATANQTVCDENRAKLAKCDPFKMPPPMGRGRHFMKQMGNGMKGMADRIKGMGERMRGGKGKSEKASDGQQQQQQQQDQGAAPAG